MATPPVIDVADARASQWAAIVRAMSDSDGQQRSASGSVIAATPAPAAAAAVPKTVRIEGDISANELAAIKAKYGDSLVSITSIDPNDMSKRIDMLGHLHTAAWEETRDKQTELITDASLVGYYHVNRPGLSEFPFDPVLSYVPIDRALGITPESEGAIRERFGATDADMTQLHVAFADMREQARLQQAPDTPAAPVAFFGQIRRKDITIVEAYDDVDRVRVFATGVRLPIGKGAYMMADACVNCTKHVMRALIKSDPARAKKALRYRIAWHQPPNSDLMGIYAAFVDEVAAREEDMFSHTAGLSPVDKATEDAAVEALAQMLQKTELFDSPTANVSAALAAIANVSVPVQEATENPTHKPPGSDLGPF